jgi:hypothetical protein
MKIGDAHPTLNLLRVNSVDKGGNPTSWKSIGPVIIPGLPGYERLAVQFQSRHLTRIGNDSRIPGTR